MAVDTTHVYRANSEGNTIGRARLDGSEVENSFISGARWPCGVAIEGGHIYWGNAGTAKASTGRPAIGRANLEGTDADQAWVVGMLDVCGVAIDP